MTEKKLVSGNLASNVNSSSMSSSRPGAESRQESDNSNRRRAVAFDRSIVNGRGKPPSRTGSAIAAVAAASKARIIDKISSQRDGATNGSWRDVEAGRASSRSTSSIARYSSTVQSEARSPLFGDIWLLVLTIGVTCFGMLVLYSTTGVTAAERHGSDLFYVKRQAFALAIGLAAMFVASRLSVDWLRKYSSLALPIAIFLLALPLIPGIGDTAGGARRWIVLPGLRFQPAEVAKLFFIIFMAGYLTRQETRLSSFLHGVVIPIGLCSICGALLLLQPDFGSTAVLFGVTIILLAVSGMRIRYLFLALFAAILAGSALIVMSPYRFQRVIAFLSPWEDAAGSGYQLIQSLIAVGTGSFFGVGLGASQQKLFFLPAAHTDFILAVIAEELGFLGVVAVLGVFLLILWRGVRLALRWIDDLFGFALALGMTAVIVVPALLNMGVVSGLLPTKGMVLPLIAYGGSNLISSLAAIGILLAISRSTPKTI